MFGMTDQKGSLLYWMMQTHVSLIPDGRNLGLGDGGTHPPDGFCELCRITKPYGGFHCHLLPIRRTKITQSRQQKQKG